MTKSWKEVRDEITKETEEIWLKEPEDIKKLISGAIECRAGSYGQFFSTLVFVHGEIRAIASYLAYGLIKAATYEEFTLSHLKNLAKMNFDIAPGFLAYCGLKRLGEFTADLLLALDTLKTKEEFTELIKAYMCYCNRLHTWMLLLFPWHLGATFLYTTSEDTFKETLKKVIEINMIVSGHKR